MLKLSSKVNECKPLKWGPLEDVPQSGNAPQAILGDDLRAVAPIWADLVEFGETNAVIKRIFGWVRDMYAFDFAAVRVGLTVHYPPVPFNKLMVQPPAGAYTRSHLRST